MLLKVCQGLKLLEQLRHMIRFYTTFDIIILSLDAESNISSKD